MPTSHDGSTVVSVATSSAANGHSFPVLAPAATSRTSSHVTTTTIARSAAGLPDEGIAVLPIGGTATATGGTPSGGSEIVVLTPSRLRVDSRVVFSHSTIQWLSNCVFCIFILLKLEKKWDVSWWVVFIPTWINHALHIPLQILVLCAVNHLIYKQIGPPPPVTATSGLHLQYALLRRTRSRSHVVDGINSLLETIAMLAVKVMFCWNLERADGGASWMSLRLMFVPFWVVWVLTAALSCAKDRSERMFGSTRDLLYIFFLFLAFKVDGQSSYTWRIVFVIPWMWFAALFLLCTMVLVLLLFARVWARIMELLLPLGFFCLLVSAVPQFVSYVHLVKRLDNGPSSGISLQDILLPNAISWFLMWLSSVVLALGLRQKEVVRELLLQSGAVWTAHEHIARRLHTEREAAQRKIDNLTEEEIAHLVEEMMAGKTKPLQLVRVGATLYKRVTSFDNGTSRIATPPAPDLEQVMPRPPTAKEAAGPEALLQQKVAPLDAVESGGIKAVREPSMLLQDHADDDLEASHTPSKQTHEVNIPGSATASEMGSEDSHPSSVYSHPSSRAASRRQSQQEGERTPQADSSQREMRREGSRRSLAAGQQGSTAQVELAVTEGPEQRTARITPAIPEVQGEAELEIEDGKPEGPTDSSTQVESLEDNLCIICYETAASCVFLECGHGGFCRKCAWRLFVRPPNECPTCRQRIEQVVEIAEEATVGQPVKVKL